ncbi:MAG: UvrB/UvrC motif-containing protein, partial [Parachlamydiaceae bacterium]
TIAITSERRKLQIAYNEKHGITPKTIKKEITALIAPEEGEKESSKKPAHRLKEEDVQKKIRYYQAEMKKAAKEMRFEDAAHFRDQMRNYQNLDLAYGGED